MNAELALKLMEEAANAVAAFTGLKNQFINSGWSKENAETMVIEILRKSGEPTHE